MIQYAPDNLQVSLFVKCHTMSISREVTLSLPQSSDTLVIGGSRGLKTGAPLSVQFHFHAVFGKKLGSCSKIRSWLLPRLGILDLPLFITPHEAAAVHLIISVVFYPSY